MSDYTKTFLMNALTLIGTGLSAYGISLTQGQIQQRKRKDLGSRMLDRGRNLLAGNPSS